MSGARVTHGGSELGRWEIASATPDPRLAWGVRGYVGVESRLTVKAERHLPSGEAAIVVNLGEPYEAVGPAGALKIGRAAVMGVHTQPFRTLGDGAKALVLIRLAPPTAQWLLGLPMSELADRWACLEDLEPVMASDLTGAVSAAADWPARFQAAERVLAARLTGAPVTPAAIAWDAIRRAGGALSIAGLAGASGVSHRRFTEAFRRAVGVGPKTAARIARFNRVLAALGRTGRAPGADAAAEHGYFDQAHMLAEFRAFAGAPPTAIRKSLAAFTLRA
jgi:AraC-like DNA-binding protein